MLQYSKSILKQINWIRLRLDGKIKKKRKKYADRMQKEDREIERKRILLREKL